MWEVLELHNVVLFWWYVLWQVHVFQIENLWKYEFLELYNMSYFPPELTTVLHIRFWFSNLESILQKMFSSKLLLFS